MTLSRGFIEALDQAIDSLKSGESIDEVLARNPSLAAQLRPLLESAAGIGFDTRYEQPDASVSAADARIRAAVRLARAGERKASDADVPWWNRRLAIASASVPVLVLAAAVVGVGGAATATVAVTTGVPDAVLERIERAGSDLHLPMMGGNDDATPPGHVPGFNAPPTQSNGPSVPGGEHTPPADPPLEAITVAGSVDNPRGSVFDLVLPDGAVYVVQTDANTSIEGELAEAAIVSVDGDLVGQDRILAARVVVTKAAPGQSATPDNADVDPEPTPTSTPADSTTPSGLNATKTAPGQAEKTKTPGPPEMTRTPGPPETTRTPGGGSNNDGGQSMNGGSIPSP